MNADQLPDHIKRLNPHLFSSRTAHLEPGTGNAVAAKNAPQTPDTQYSWRYPVTITVLEYRHRLHDADGGCAKWLIDSLVAQGVFKDDSPGFIREVRSRQVKIPANEPEKTELLVHE